MRSDFAAAYIDAGLVLVPIPSGKKGPTTKGWNHRENCINTPEKAAQLNGGNIGLAHVFSRTCALDVDDYQKADAWLAGRGIDLTALLTEPGAVQISSGRENRAKLLYRLPAGADPLTTHKVDNAIEFRCAAANGMTVQDILPPSIHPDTGRPYIWKGDWRKLPELPAPVLALWRSLGKPKHNGESQRFDRRSILDGIGEGQRDEALFKYACSLQAKGNTQAEAEALVKQAAAACNPPFSESEALAKVARVYRQYGGTEPRLSGFVDTDLANGERFARMHGEHVFYTPERGWLIWDGKRWRVDEHNTAMALAKKTAQRIFAEIEHAEEKHQKALFKWARQSQSKERLTAMLDLAKSEPGVPESLTTFDADQYVLNCWNGVLDLRTGQLSAHDPSRMLSKITRVEYRAGAFCPLWLKFLDRIMRGDMAMIDFLQRAAGYTLTGDTSSQCLFFAYGTGANGKSVFLETLMTLLGEYATNTRAETIMLKQYGSGIPNDVARLVGMRFVAISETEQGQRMAESQIKDMTGGDRVTARFLRKEFFDFKPEFKLWIRGNHKPRITGTDDGIWRRIHLVPFEVQIPEAERDGALVDKLRAELPGILAWAVEGARKWAQTGLQVPDKVKAATAEYREDMDRLADFIAEACVTGAGFSAYSGQLYSAYKAWCDTSGDSPMSQTAFGLALAERGYAKKIYTGRKRYIGIGLNAADQRSTTYD